MRRGLMSWSSEEMPVTTLETRVARLQEAMRGQGLDAVLAYTSFAQPAAVHWLTNFTPYWSEAVLVVLPDGAPTLLAALTPRVHPWIREVSHLGDLVSAPRLGENTAALLAERLRPDGRIGVIGLDSLPWSIGSHLLESTQYELVDASALFLGVRQPGDAAEQALAARAAAIGRAALASAPHHGQGTSALAAAMESTARLAGAEEVLQRIAPDLRRSGALVRLETDMPLGSEYAVELSIAYKGVWVRVGRSVSRNAPPRTWDDADAWFDDTLASLAQSGEAAPRMPGSASRWSLEASTGLQPLSVVTASDNALALSLPAGSPAVFSAHLDLDGAHWFRSAPLTMGPLQSAAAGDTARTTEQEPAAVGDRDS